MPIPMSEKLARRKMIAPILPVTFLRRNLNKPMAKLRLKSPLKKSPKLNSVEVIPGTTPKSLSALFIQLNCGYVVAIANPINVNANTGVRMPATPPNRSQNDFLYSDKQVTLQDILAWCV